MDYKKSERLNNLSYAIRGPIFDKAQALEAAGHNIINLNIGNPAPFGFDIPDEIVEDMILNIRNAQGYCHHLGIFPARKAIMHYTQQIGIQDVRIEDIFIGNGVSELIVMCMQALINPGDEILIPSPDYPLWTTAVGLSGGKAVHYVCDEQADWNPDVADMASKVTSKTKAIVLINPNNPTGAVYEKDVLEQIVKLARENNLIVFADEIYDKILFDGNKHVPIASLSDEVFFMTFGGLSKNYRATGFRGGWVIASGAKEKAKSYLEGINLLASMRLCANVPTQYAIQTALGGYQSIDDLVAEGGRLRKQRDLIHYRLTDIPGITCVKPKGSLYVFPKIDMKKFSFGTDEQFTLDLLTEQKILVVPGSGFNAFDKDHFRIVFLPNAETLDKAVDGITELLDEKRVNIPASAIS
ncbi:pyridoxal phosphate-dependent aminotransferase [Arcticibacterium luteifluviistationis]|uniref:alanine transaminase n=1 Tax=Arcticibacterium luteifluviistationis TaxID=1784714 RepID=A0A2Z4G7P3_9BACT|nr:pyridoxal phosphate-dependent aminotransferase [Arcticibacterium luteifluviistationis]AWV97194.1 aminotransferase [Arcticibacterium luteifluviistationis]